MSTKRERYKRGERQRQRRQKNMMEDRINSLSEMRWVRRASVCVRSVGDKQVYLCKQRTAAKHRPPRVWLRIQLYKKNLWHTAPAQAKHTHVQWLCQSHADVQSIPEACHKRSGRGACARTPGERRANLVGKRRRTSSHPACSSWLLLFEFTSSKSVAEAPRK